jgi:hypothetical protein
MRWFISWRTPPGANHDRLQRKIAAGQVEREGLVDSHDLIDPSLERRRHAVIVHRRTQNNNVGAVEFVDQFVRQHDRFALLWGSCRRVGEDSADPGFCRRRRWVQADVAADYGVARSAVFPDVDEILRQTAR